MNILLTSSTFSNQVLKVGKPLIAAYFPTAQIYVAEDDQEPEAVVPDAFRLGVDTAEGYECGLVLSWKAQGEVTGEGFLADCTVRLREAEIQQIMRQLEVGRDEPVKVFLKHGLLKLLGQVCGRQLPWGILTGIRPSKLVQRLRNLNLTTEEQALFLHSRYAIRSDKIELLQEIGQVQEPYLRTLEENPRAVAVYIGIPFCPTRCSYCSFPAYVLGRERQELTEYWAALRAEIQRAGQQMKALGLWASTLYIGGGTPTILTTAEMARLIEHALTHIPHSDLEFTVEGGRPDTLTREKLLGLKEWGVNRLSINPQTMHDRTLQRIGRAHDVKSVTEAFQLAREISDWVINMDLILGLPGEDLDDVRLSLERIGQLNPDNLTLHALAIKRGSKEMESGYAHLEPERIEKMQAVARESARLRGMRPYYLYRQKQIAGNLENIGYARPGLECRYNIAIMEERQTVIGLGAGAASKMVNYRDYSLQNMQHPANWQAYIKRWAELDERRWANSQLTN